MKLKNKIQLFTTVWLILVLVLVNLGVYLLFSSMTIQAELNRLKEQIGQIVEAMKPNTDPLLKPADILRSSLPVNGMIRVLNENADPHLIITKRTELTELPITYSSGQATFTLQHPNGEQFAVAQHPLIWNDGSVVTLEVSESLAVIQGNIQRLGIVLVLASLTVLLPVYIGSRLLGRVILLPIQAMIATMEEIRQDGGFKKIRLKARGQDELGQMAFTFNRMIDLLKENFEKQQQFVSDASHELRTPLTILESYASLLKRWGTKRPDILEEGVDAIYSEALRMRGLTEQLLQLAKEDMKSELQLASIELVSFCQQVSKTIANSYQREIIIHSQIPTVYAYTDHQKLKQILYILLDNAFKYSDEKVVLTIGQDKVTPYFSIQDLGIGIPKNELSNVFDRFYRVDKARQRRTGGSGLGLSIAREIIHHLGGEIELQSEEGKGTCVTVFLREGKQE